jgi:hypothetical protein
VRAARAQALKVQQTAQEGGEKNMAYGSVSYEPFTSMQAHLRIIGVEEVDGKFEETPKQAKVEFEVLDYEESDDNDGDDIGWSFTDWFGFSRDKKTGVIGISKSAKAKLPNLIKAALYPDGQKVIDNDAFEVEMLKGKEVRARVVRSGKNEDGDHSRIKAESIMPKPRATQRKAIQAEEDKDFEDLDMSEAPDFSNLKEEAS